jgi:hypothetical protein
LLCTDPPTIEDHRERLKASKPVIFQAIAKKLEQDDPDFIFGFAQMFDEVQFPAPTYQHCVFCHKNFDPRVKNNKACKVEHAVHESR